eukprot:TRINITY_DN2781_c0_g1_i3.p1 TRINITY_DN2781_c0_g1~~TRINITY_DN2781_c0_g1_i3.p1  ORF type:complete len:125 (-),score=26.00 TRINITY_DN2781_c0_g1_i3:324-698(-)
MEVAGSVPPAVLAILGGLAKSWLEEDKSVDLSKVVQYLGLGTKDGYEGKGIATKMTAESIVHNKLLGFEKAFVVASAVGSQRVFEKLGFKKVGELLYKDFTFEDNKPFEGLVQPNSAKAYVKVF